MDRNRQYPANAGMTDDVEETAASWFLRIQEGFSQSEFREWRQWLAESDSHADAFDAVSAFWKESGRLAELPWPSEIEIANDTYEGFSAIQPRVKLAEKHQRSGTGRTYAWFAAAASVAAIGLLGFLIGPDPDLDGEFRHYQTRTAEHRSIVLPDGSNISLGAASEVAVHYDSVTRRIELRKGRAFFKVAKDKDRPFIVGAGVRTIRAVGTEFDVNIGIRDIKVSVVEGQVRVDGPNGPAVQNDLNSGTGTFLNLSAGETMDYNATASHGMVYKADPKLATAWLEGRLAYSSVALESVIVDVNRYSQTPLIIGDDAVKRMLFTGTIFEDDIENWLGGLEKVFPVRLVPVDGHGILLIHKKS